MAVDLVLDHAIGFSGSATSPLHLHPNGQEAAYAQGGCIVISDLNDPHKQEFLQGHDDYITCMAMSSKGTFVVSGQRGENADVIVWDFALRKEVYRFQEHDHGIATIQVSEDERFLVSVGVDLDHKMVVWDLHTGCIVAQQSKVEPVTCVCWGGRKKNIKRRETTDYQIVTGGPGKLTYWTLDPIDGKLSAEECNLGNQNRNFTSVTFSLDAEYFFAGSSSGDVTAVHVKHLMMHAQTAIGTNGVHSLVPMRTPYGDRFIAGCGDGTIAVYDGQRDGGSLCRSYSLAGSPKCCTALVEGGVRALQLQPSESSDEIRLLAGTDLGNMYAVTLVVSHASAEPSASRLLHESHHDSVTAVAYPPHNSKAFATCSRDGTIRIWDVDEYQVTAKATCQTQLAGVPSSLAFTGEVVFSGWTDGKIRSHEAEQGVALWHIDNCHHNGVTSIEVSHNQKFIVSGGEEGEVRVWEIRTREMILHLKQHTMAVSSLQLFENDMQVVSASRDRTIYIWDLRQGARVGALTQKMGGVNCICLLPDGQQLLSVGQEKRLAFWHVKEPAPLQVADAGSELLCVCTDAAGELCATAGVDCKVRVWSIKDGVVLCEGTAHSGTVRQVCFSPDGKQLVSVGDDSCVLIWNIFPSE